MSMRTFSYQALPNRVVFGAGSLSKLNEEADRLGIGRALVVCTPQQTDAAEVILQKLGTRGVSICARATMHTPTEVTQLAIEDLLDARADGVVSIGGGSTIGLAKALSVRTDLPHIAIPTTYAGSEMTPILGETDNGIKSTRRELAILPATAIYDVELTFSLPPALSATSGINAIAHAVEALYAPDGNPVISLMAEEAIKSLARALPVIQRNPLDREARELAFYGSWLAGTCLGSVSMSIHHKLCHTLGGSFDLPHAETHTVVLPYATAYVAEAAPDAMAAIRRALGKDGSAAQGLQELAKSVDAPTSLEQIGMSEDGLDRAADLATSNPYWSPRPLERDAIRGLLEKAFKGERPD